jgi:hypothetical protein
MLANGAYVENEKYVKGKLCFWGEWEPPSRVSSLERSQKEAEKLYPQYLHEPFLQFPP